jgi:hypothetical protein
MGPIIHPVKGWAIGTTHLTLWTHRVGDRPYWSVPLDPRRPASRRG